MIPPATFQSFLFSALVEPPGCPQSKRFFPNTVFTELIDERVVHKELQRQLEYLDPGETRRLTTTICGTRSFKKVFSLLAIVDKLSDIKHFIEQDVCDIKLPLKKIAPPGCNIFTLGVPSGPGSKIRPIVCLERWNLATIRMFEEWQWSTLAHTFQCGEPKNIDHISLPDDVPLPFMTDSQYDSDSGTIQGGYSIVFKVTIHPAHHLFHCQEVSSHTFRPLELSLSTCAAIIEPTSDEVS